MRPQFFLPLLTYPDATSERMISNAVMLARHLQAALIVCPIYVAIPDVGNALSSIIVDAARMTREAEALSRGRGEALVAQAIHEARAATVELTVRDITAGEPFIGEKAARAGRIYDLVLIGTIWSEQAFVEAVLFDAGRPLLLYPPGSFGGRIDRLAAAWDGSRSAARALADARPFLEQASHVSLIAIVDEKPIEQESVVELADNLKRSGLNVDVQLARSHGSPIGQVLQTKASEAGADLLVMGGFGHSRLREFILGGATRGVLTNITMPVLMSH